MLAAITLDRHRAITRPLSVPGSPYKLLAATWFFSLLPSLPSISIFTVELRISEVSSLLQPECVTDFVGWTNLWRKIYYFGVAVLVFILPLIILICLFGHIIYELWVTVNKIKNRVGFELQLFKYLSYLKVERHRDNLISRARIKTTNLSMAVVITFILTNLPYIIDEFIRQRIVPNQQCNTDLCHFLKVSNICPL